MLLDKMSLLVHEACSADPARPVLQNILVEKDGTTVATDGHVLFVVQPGDSEEADFPAIVGTEKAEIGKEGILIPAEIAKEAISNLPKKITLPILGNACLKKEVGSDSLCLASTNQGTTKRVTITQKDSEFPKWRQVMPLPLPDDIVVALNPNLLANMCHVAAQATRNVWPEITLRIRRDPDKAAKDAMMATARCSGVDGRYAFMVIMPLRVEDNHAQKQMDAINAILGATKKEDKK